jgi:hypothetical protein
MNSSWLRSAINSLTLSSNGTESSRKCAKKHLDQDDDSSTFGLLDLYLKEREKSTASAANCTRNCSVGRKKRVLTVMDVAHNCVLFGCWFLVDPLVFFRGGRSPFATSKRPTVEWEKMTMMMIFLFSSMEN